MPNLSEGLEGVRERHIEFIEATFHIRHPRLLAERHRLLEDSGVFQPPWIGAAPAYERHGALAGLQLPGPVTALLTRLASVQNLSVYDPPYVHQGEALVAFFRDLKDIVVATGTGSGKTEIFLHAILGHLALEGSRGRTNRMRGVRALILYPMNALVADQLARIRRLFGEERAAAILSDALGRVAQFGSYTSRTPYHGLKDVNKDARTLDGPMGFYLELLRDPSRGRELDDLRKRGRIPAKDLAGFAGAVRRADRYRTQKGDRELLTRQEMLDPANTYGGTPDLLITNYSMLQYMMLRPIEQRIFDDTRSWLKADPENKLLLVLDEAHLYRGAQGAEVALLVKRLLQHLHVGRDRIRCIITSASLGAAESARTSGPRFASDLAGGDPGQYTTITGVQFCYSVDGASGRPVLGRALAELAGNLSDHALSRVASSAGWPPRPAGLPLPAYLGEVVPTTPEFQRLYNLVSSKPVPLHRLACSLFPDVPGQMGIEATLNLLLLSTTAVDPTGNAVLPSRVHLFYRGLLPQFVCLSSNCASRRATEGTPFLGQIFNGPRERCTCGARAFELYTHRTCGAAYLKAYRRKLGRNQYPAFLWSSCSNLEEFEEIHLLLEEPRPDVMPGERESLFVRTPRRFIDTLSGFLLDRPASESSLPVWIPTDPPSHDGFPWTWKRCPVCGIADRLKEGRSKVSDLETKGEQPFANLVQAVFSIQPASNPDPRLSNHGRKVLCFSDSRQKAARLARDVQFAVQLDSMRGMFVRAARTLPRDFPLSKLFTQFVIDCELQNIAFFDDRDATLSFGGTGYSGSRSTLLDARKALREGVVGYEVPSIFAAVHSDDLCRDLDQLRPLQYDWLLLRHLGDVNYSLEATLVGYVRPRQQIIDGIAERMIGCSRNLLEDALYVVVHSALEKRAYDPRISTRQRRASRSSRPGGGYGPDCEGLDAEDLLPEHLNSYLETRLGQDGCLQLRRMLRMSVGSLRLFEPGGNRWFLNPEAVTLVVDLDRPWHRCIGCRQFSAAGIDGMCPRQSCGGRLELVDPSDPHLAARRDLFRLPAREIFEGTADPFTIRAEEHSAQISTRDLGDVFSKAETYELLFQDVLLGSGDLGQPIDVLSCTTTMEVGIDIGTLAAVALRTVPPRPDNYQQRSGRAGRRGTSISTILTFADNSPYESYVFDHPDVLIGAEPSEPIIYIDNPKIAARHVNASLFQLFFHRDGSSAGNPGLTPDSDLFASLGTVGEFYGFRTEYSYDSFVEWAREQIERPSLGYQRICELLPAGLSRGRSSTRWRQEFVAECTNGLLADLSRLRPRATASLELAGTNLLETLLEQSVLPSFSFPTSLCRFTVREVDPATHAVRTAFDMQSDLMQALSQYVPGREVVVDKRSFVSYGISIDFPRNLADQAASEPWDALPRIGICHVCSSIVHDPDNTEAALPLACPVCGCSLSTLPIYTPQGFAPEYVDRTAREDVDADEEKTRALGARMPLPVGAIASLPPLGPAWRNVRSSHQTNESLILVNLGGRDEAGFSVCHLCGALSVNDTVPVPHNRPYPREPRVRVASQCRGPSSAIALGYRFRTDMTVVRVPLNESVNLTAFGNETPLAQAAMSLAEALGIAAAREIGIDSSELAVGHRLVPGAAGHESNVSAYIDFFMYDTTPGGAGFASAANANLARILDCAGAILRQCDCASSCQKCLRTYQNRFNHSRLNRHFAASLLEYMRTGSIPGVPDERLEPLFRSLASGVTVLASTRVQISAAPVEGGGTLSRPGRELRVRILPALAGGTSCHEAREDGQRVLIVSEFVLVSDLPRAVVRASDALE